eukprot:1185049-Prorocentrum_minimum.AAC.1
MPGAGINRRRDRRIYPPAKGASRWRGPIGGGTRGYTRGGDQSEEGQEDIPGAGTNRRRDRRRVCPGRGPIGRGTGGGYARGGDQSEEGLEDIPTCERSQPLRHSNSASAIRAEGTACWIALEYSHKLCVTHSTSSAANIDTHRPTPPGT